MTLKDAWCRRFVLGLACAAALSGAARGEAKSRSEIDALIRQLGAPSAARREAAVRELVSVGPDAMAALDEARSNRDPEVAARARALYEKLANVPMFGARVTLRAEPARVKWDEPFDLRVTIETDSFGCVVPFSTQLASLLPFGSDARQAGLVLDVADFLEVRGPDDRLIDPHLFDATDDPSVIRAAEMRAGGLNYARQSAHERETTVVPALNRGRVRYRMHAAGTYRMRLAFEPEWDDPVLAAAHAGRTESDWIKVEIASDAPARVRADGALLDVVVEQAHGFVTASIINAYDLPLSVNMNLNGGSPLYARASWVVWHGDEREAVALSPTGPYDPGRFEVLAPDERVEVARIAMSDLDGEAVAFRYDAELSKGAADMLSPRVSPPERHWLSALPAYVATGRFESEALPLTMP